MVVVEILTTVKMVMTLPLEVVLLSVECKDVSRHHVRSMFSHIQLDPSQ